MLLCFVTSLQQDMGCCSSFLCSIYSMNIFLMACSSPYFLWYHCCYFCTEFARLSFRHSSLDIFYFNTFYQFHIKNDITFSHQSDVLWQSLTLEFGVFLQIKSFHVSSNSSHSVQLFACIYCAADGYEIIPE